jgi:hypothetical protein
MGRFAYQPLQEEEAHLSQSGQLIIGRQDGHLSVNKNGIIISKTKEIEEKIADINELKHDVDEQEDVILNLIEDFYAFVANEFEEANRLQERTYEFDKYLLSLVKYMDEIDRGMEDKMDRIQEMINDLRSANNLQNTRLESMEREAGEVLDTIGTMAYVQNEYNKITSLRITYA